MTTKLKYSGSTPGADTNTYTLFDTTALCGAAKSSTASMLNADRITVRISNDQAGTLNVYRSQNNGASWQLTQSGISVSIGTGNFYDFYVGGLLDWKIEWVNGGSAQTVWNIDMALLEGHPKVT